MTKDDITKFLYHLGKATWKMVPVIGPFVEELVYEQFKEVFMPTLNTLTEQDLFEIEKRIPKIDFEQIDKSLDKMSEELKAELSISFFSLFDFITIQGENILNELKKNQEISRTILGITSRIEQNIGNETAKLDALKEIHLKRELWIELISENQKLLIEKIPTDYTEIDQLWELTKNLIPHCAYKEFCFRLHELEWLGLVIRNWNKKWYYKKT